MPTSTNANARNSVLYIVSTPIGNLEDITLRALRTLREVNLIAAEDTRRTRKLLAHFDIHTPITSLFEGNQVRKGGKLITTERRRYNRFGFGCGYTNSFRSRVSTSGAVH
jgi:16S rRNA C1402 (ribose-2'-O) methylase RsmI